ncbi:hypothetical protein [Petrocella sp. FN5]|uniref:hypothetical protein n=1 Tax=Petrocella sp. FN5 TaxID=3032002 RepID=UPI0023D99AC6|nr:hypothetical protein [Petrocella sp. FN5]MDF1617214.1 hypothetical protein [Petrocella sp. FN5]
MAKKLIKMRTGEILEDTKENIVAKISEQVLKEIYDSGTNEKLKAKEVLKKFNKYIVMTDVEIQAFFGSTFATNISKSVETVGCGVSSNGNGYYYSEPLSQKNNEDRQCDDKSYKTRKIEELLYEPIAEYFIDVDDKRSLIVANKRPDGLSRKSIPDILVSDIDYGVIATSDITITSVEVKATRDLVNIDALHQTLNYVTRCHNSIIIFAVPESEAMKEVKEHVDFHHSFGIGIGYVIMQDDYYKAFVDGRLDRVDLGEVSIKIMYRPNWNLREPRIIRDYLNKFGVQNNTEMLNWNGNWSS